MGSFSTAWREAQAAFHLARGEDPEDAQQQARLRLEAQAAGIADEITRIVLQRVHSGNAGGGDPAPLGNDPFAVHHRSASRSTPAASAARPDGPDDRTGFVWQGTLIDLKRASLRRRLLVALWDKARGRPLPAVQVTTVMGILWPDDDDVDRNLKDLVHQVNRVFHKAGKMLSIHQGNGRIWLQEGP